MRQNKTVVSEKFYEACSGWPPTDVNGFIEWLNNKVSDMPEEYRNTAQIEIHSEIYYDQDAFARITILYQRPETDAEMEKRENKNSIAIERKKREELKLLAQLKAKYEG